MAPPQPASFLRLVESWTGKSAAPTHPDHQQPLWNAPSSALKVIHNKAWGLVCSVDTALILAPCPGSFRSHGLTDLESREAWHPHLCKAESQLQILFSVILRSSVSTPNPIHSEGSEIKSGASHCQNTKHHSLLDSHRSTIPPTSLTRFFF